MGTESDLNEDMSETSKLTLQEQSGPEIMRNMNVCEQYVSSDVVFEYLLFRSLLGPIRTIIE